MSEAPVHVVPYDSSWPEKFQSEKALLEELLAPWRRGPIEHVGSTAVAGLCAKPVIDVMVGVRSLSESEPAKDTLREAGYEYAEYKTDVMHWFCKPSFAFRTHHVHLNPFESPLWHERLAFRDLLRTNPSVAEEYALFKRSNKNWPGGSSSTEKPIRMQNIRSSCGLFDRWAWTKQLANTGMQPSIGAGRFSGP